MEHALVVVASLNAALRQLGLPATAAALAVEAGFSVADLAGGADGGGGADLLAFLRSRRPHGGVAATTAASVKLPPPAPLAAKRPRGVSADAVSQSAMAGGVVVEQPRGSKSAGKRAADSAAAVAVTEPAALAPISLAVPALPSVAPAPAPAVSADKRPFQRVDAREEFAKIKDSRLADNTYVGTFGDDGYGFKANEVLSRVRGKDFRSEKTKKKRGSYRGGVIDVHAVRSVKLD